jgi:uncharacterized protein (UPF0276 family)
MTRAMKNGATRDGACGIGLRAPHYVEFQRARPALEFVEVHSENFFGVDNAEIGGAPRRLLERVRADYDLSLHGVGLSLGSAEPLSRSHLQQLKNLERRFEPRLLSDHLAWVGIDGSYANDLLPLPYTEESLAVVRDNVLAAQDFLGRTLLIENPSSYLSFPHSTIPEPEFMNALVRATGCGILLDVNTVYVSAVNVGFDAREYLAAIDAASVGEIHLAGFTRTPQRLIDTHSRPVDAAVWALYEFALQRCGAVPTLIEWDADLPELAALLDEARHASTLLARGGAHAGAA